ncbi:MAG: alpha-(1-_3)-arabinofuranosyltransferase domain-containing protein [Ilumatobacteraceae bacterium]
MTSAGPTDGHRARWSRRSNGWSLSLLVVLAYVPLLVAQSGRMVADTKLYLYLNPGRLVSDAALSWDSRQFGGWVPHQIVAYLWPQGPWYWLMSIAHVPDWVAHRLWVGTLFVLAGLGARWAARTLGLPLAAATVVAVAYQVSPYVLPYASRTSAMLLPWTALGWVIGLTVRAALARRPWGYAAALALVVGSCSAVNTTAILMIAPAPVLWLLDAGVRRLVPWRRVVSTAGRIALLCLGTSMWWIEMVRIQGAYGADLLSYSESLQATNFTTASTEVLRGMGYWLFYVRDAYAFTTTAGGTFMSSPLLIGLTFVVLAAGLTGIIGTRWASRRFAALLVLVGTVLAVGAHPIDDPAPLARPLAEYSRSGIALALRSSARAVPLVSLGLALGLGALVAAVGATGARSGSRRSAMLAAVAVVVLVAANPALLDGDIVDPALARDDPPSAWLDAADLLSNGDTGARVLQLPGAEFGAFAWGYTVDPPLPGLTTKPLLTRDLLPLGSAGLEDLSYALDDRFQDGIAEPASLAAVARLLGVDTVWLAGDLAAERFRNPWPADSRAVLDAAPGLRRSAEFGTAGTTSPSIDMVDEHLYVTGRDGGRAVPVVVLYSVDSPVPVARTATRVVLVAGSGDGVIDAAAAGLLAGDEAIVYAAHVADGSVELHGAPAVVLLTDSNRDRAHHWRSSQDVSGFTETGAPGSDLLEPDESDRRLPVFGDSPESSQQTVARVDGLTVWASGYGEPFAYLPEHRPAMAVDGDISTSWVVGDRADPVGERIRVSSTSGQLQLLQPQGAAANRMITQLTVHEDGHAPVRVALDESSLRDDGQVVPLAGTGPVTVEITAVGPRPGGTDTGPSAVGFAELGVGAHAEWVRLPTLPATTAGVDDVAIVLTRLRIDPLDRWRSDPEPQVRREFELPERRAWDLAVTLRLSATASDTVLSSVTGRTGAVAEQRLHGDPAAAGVSAVDGDLGTSWTTPFGQVVGSTLSLDTRSPFAELSITQPTDGRHSTITALVVSDDQGSFTVDVPAPGAAGPSRGAVPRPPAGPSVRFTIDEIHALPPVDRRYGETTVLPAAMIELDAAGLAGETTAPATGDCRDDLVRVDGTPLPLDVSDEDLVLLRSGAAVTVQPCVAVDLRAGTHRIESAAGGSTGLDVDRIVVSSRAGTAPTPPSSSPTVQRVEVDGLRTRRALHVPPCPDGCWLVWGEGYTPGWQATAGGTDLGEPSPVNNGNAWWIAPTARPTTVEIRWLPQQREALALVASAASVLCCLGLVLWPLRRRGTPTAATTTYEHLAMFDTTFTPQWCAPLRERASTRSAVAAASVLVLGSAVVITPVAAIALTPLALFVVTTRRIRAIGAAAPALALLIGAYVTLRQAIERIPANAAWVTAWDRVHRPGLVIALVLAVATISDRRAGPSAPRPPRGTATDPAAA